MHLSERALTEISGRFVKIAYASEAERVLATKSADRPPARFNRKGENALDLSPDRTSAMVAIGQYIRADDAPRVLLELDVAPCVVLDLRHVEADCIYAFAKAPWLPALARGEEPLSWRASDFLRANNVAGLIDPSKRRPGLWALTLFCWNVEGAPRIDVVAPPMSIGVPVDFR